jgi:hypothetical protein
MDFFNEISSVRAQPHFTGRLEVWVWLGLLPREIAAFPWLGAEACEDMRLRKCAAVN